MSRIITMGVETGRGWAIYENGELLYCGNITKLREFLNSLLLTDDRVHLILDKSFTFFATNLPRSITSLTVDKLPDVDYTHIKHLNVNKMTMKLYVFRDLETLTIGKIKCGGEDIKFLVNLLNQTPLQSLEIKELFHTDMYINVNEERLHKFRDAAYQYLNNNLTYSGSSNILVKSASKI